jgi:hypothetical protein
MSALLDILLYLSVGCGEWYLALRRTLACARGEKALLVCLVFIENILGLWVLSNFVSTHDWGLALCYASGSALGALLMACRDGRQHPRPVPSSAPYSTPL